MTGYNLGTPKTSFDIPFSPENIKKLIASVRSGPKELLLARGNTEGEHPLADPIRSCFNLNDFLTGDFDLLMDAGRLNYLNSGSGFEEFLQIRASNLLHGVDTKKEHGSNEKK